MEVIADLSAMIVKDLVNFSQDDYSNYRILFEQNIINKIEYGNIKELNGLRNRIVHD